MRGYFGIGVYNPKTEENIGTLWRSAHALGASFIFTIGRRYSIQCTDTTKAQRHVPLYEYGSLADFEEHKPKGCQTVCIELTDDAFPLATFCHPLNVAYILGAEDYGLPSSYTSQHLTTEITQGKYCLNVAVAGSIVMYDRLAKAGV